MGGVGLVMDRHFFEAFIESLTDTLADKLAQRLSLRPIVKAVDRSLVAAAEAPSSPAGPPEAADEYLDTKQVAKLLGLSVGGLENMRRAGKGPKFVYVGRAVRYRRSDLDLK